MTKIIANVKTTTRPFTDWSSSSLISLNLLIWIVIVSISIIMLGLLPIGSWISSLITSKLNETLDRLRSCLGSWRSLEQSKVWSHFDSLLFVWIFEVCVGKIILSLTWLLSSWLLSPPSIRTHLLLLTLLSTVWLWRLLQLHTASQHKQRIRFGDAKQLYDLSWMELAKMLNGYH